MEIKNNVSLKNKNWFHTGGCAQYFIQPTTPQEIIKSLIFAQKHNLLIEVLGEGANVLIADEGYDGLIIQPALKKISLQNNSITAEAGCSIQEVIDFALDKNCIGLEEFSGIPGTIGGAVYINIHYFQSFLSQFLSEARIINKKNALIKTVDKSWFQFGYDISKLQEKDWLLLDATFSLQTATDLEVAYARGRRDEIIRQRNSRYPTEKTCGSFFRNFNKDELTSAQLPFVAYYLDKLGIKGELRYGDAIVSSRHANMIVNLGNATSNDIVMLARKMQDLVFDTFGLLPQSECQFIGFKEYPLKRAIKSHPVKSSHDICSSIEP